MGEMGVNNFDLSQLELGKLIRKKAQLDLTNNK